VFSRLLEMIQGDVPMLCPNCKTEELVTSERQNIQIDHCPRCQGVWLDRGELDKIIRMASPNERQSDEYNGREIGEDDDAPRRRRRPESDQDDDDNDDDRGSQGGESYRSRDRDDDDDRSERGGSYRNRDRDDDRMGGGESQGKSIWREIFENLGDRLPRP
jgi:Zn-finger nucleic acid-binding protein